MQTQAPVRQICVSWSPYRKIEENGTPRRQADNDRSGFDSSTTAKRKVGSFSLENNPWQLHVCLGPGEPVPAGPGVGPSCGTTEGSSTVAPPCTSGDILTQAVKRLWTGRVRGGPPQKASTSSSSSRVPGSSESRCSVSRDPLVPQHAEPRGPEGLLDEKAKEEFLHVRRDLNPDSQPSGGPACHSTSHTATTLPILPAHSQGDPRACLQSSRDRPCSSSANISGTGPPAPVPLAVSTTSQIICLAPSVLQPSPASPKREPCGEAVPHVPPDKDRPACDRTAVSTRGDRATQTTCMPSAEGHGSACGEAAAGPDRAGLGGPGSQLGDRPGTADGSAGTLQVAWAHPARGLVHMHVNDDLVAAATANGMLFLLDATSGRLLRCATHLLYGALRIALYNHMDPCDGGRLLFPLPPRELCLITTWGPRDCVPRTQ